MSLTRDLVEKHQEQAAKSMCEACEVEFVQLDPNRLSMVESFQLSIAFMRPVRLVCLSFKVCFI